MIKNKHQQCGSLLIELLIVCLVVAFLASISLSKVSMLNRFLIQAEVEKIRSFCWYLQQRAQMNQAHEILDINLKDGTYQAVGKVEHLAKGITFGIMPEVKGPPSSPILPLKEVCSFANNKIIFAPDGTITSGALYLYAQGSNVLYALTVPVAELCYIRIYKYDGSWKLLA